MIKKISANDTYPLRHQLLRAHQPIEQCKFPNDQDSSTTHLGAYKNNELVGILSIFKTNNSKLNPTNGWQLRAMATTPNVRGQGYGRALINAAEECVAEEPNINIWANARLNAIGFYNKLGYSTHGDEFMITDIGPHYLVYKTFG